MNDWTGRPVRALLRDPDGTFAEVEDLDIEYEETGSGFFLGGSTPGTGRFGFRLAEPYMWTEGAGAWLLSDGYSLVVREV